MTLHIVGFENYVRSRPSCITVFRIIYKSKAAAVSILRRDEICDRILREKNVEAKR